MIDADLEANAEHILISCIPTEMIHRGSVAPPPVRMLETPSSIELVDTHDRPKPRHQSRGKGEGASKCVKKTHWPKK